MLGSFDCSFVAAGEADIFPGGLLFGQGILIGFELSFEAQVGQNFRTMFSDVFDGLFEGHGLSPHQIGNDEGG